ncbi:MAG TPA: iron-containing alcohol dehydrogenase, partial [Candidatus Corynebacterium gallistercoris]|nr:iron-containing alcohol dehydrogenase [Candidatus Corynebacterium gallistercoris]
MSTIAVRSDSPYDVSIIRGVEPAIELIASSTPRAQRYLLIHQPALADKATQVAAGLESQGREVALYELADAEAGKTLESAGRCWDACAEAGLTRQDAIVGIGGGAATDLAGFIAATWMRGIAVVHYPTTLLAMVDAAVGGKTGINTAAGKNLVGSFHEPAAVIVDLDVLTTLPREELVAGSAEIIKAGFIADTK